MEKILLHRIVIVTRIAVNVPRIVINCFGDIASGCRWVQQQCHASVDRCVGGHLLLHAGVPLRFTTCLTSYRPYGAPLPHPTHITASLRVIARRNDEAIHLCQIHVRFNYVECKAFVSKKKKEKHIHFISSYLSDSKRLQSTTNV